MLEKRKDEYEAMMVCREKVRERGLPMTIVDAEYQWYVSLFVMQALQHQTEVQHEADPLGNARLT